MPVSQAAKTEKREFKIKNKRIVESLQRSLSRGLRTSPMICPTLWRDFKSSSVLLNSFFEARKFSLTEISYPKPSSIDNQNNNNNNNNNKTKLIEQS